MIGHSVKFAASWDIWANDAGPCMPRHLRKWTCEDARPLGDLRKRQSWTTREPSTYSGTSSSGQEGSDDGHKELTPEAETSTCDQSSFAHSSDEQLCWHSSFDENIIMLYDREGWLQSIVVGFSSELGTKLCEDSRKSCVRNLNAHTDAQPISPL